MKERPILFSGEMVRAILDGRKTQTRRVVKPQPTSIFGSGVAITGNTLGARSDAFLAHCDFTTERRFLYCPFGKPGDRLWVRETWSPDASSIYPFPGAWYRASDNLESGQSHNCPKDYRGKWGDCLACWEEANGRFRWRPSIHMPRWASRITLEITNVRVERLHGISERDAEAEGIACYGDTFTDYENPKEWLHVPSMSFCTLWRSIYGAKSWDENPWVWVIEFKRVVP